jgi:ATP-dependent DNA ligase
VCEYLSSRGIFFDLVSFFCARSLEFEKLPNKTADIRLRFSASFDDGEKLLALTERTGLVGIVSKRRDPPYRSRRCDWIKVKCRAWREAKRTETATNSSKTPLKPTLSPKLTLIRLK